MKEINIKIVLLIISIIIFFNNINCTKIVKMNDEEYMIIKNHKVKILKGDWLTDRVYIFLPDVIYTNLRNLCVMSIYSSKLKDDDKRLSLETLATRELFSIGVINWQKMSPTREPKEINGKKGIEIDLTQSTWKRKIFAFIEDEYFYLFIYGCNPFEYEGNLSYFYEVIRNFEKVE
jgi:hypothetical protein